MNRKQEVLDALNATVGVWQSTGSMRTDDGLVQVVGTDAYEWLPGKQFMIHKADVTVGGDKVDVIEIIGEFDDTKQACAMHAFQSDGSHGVMWASLTEDGNLLFAGDDMRATLTVEPAGAVMDALWERLESGKWTHWMDMHFVKRV